MRQALLISSLFAAFGLTACSPQDSKLTPPTATASVAKAQSASAPETQIVSAPFVLEGSWEDALPVYYQTPDPGLKRALVIVHKGLNDPLTSQKGSAFHNFSMWAARVLATQPKQTMVWCQELRSQHPNNMLYPLFKIADTPDSKKCLSQLDLSYEERREYAETEIPTVKDFLNLPFSPAVLDIHWVSFYATGQPEYVYRIVDYVADNVKIMDSKPEQDQSKYIDLTPGMTYGAARWSLASNMRQYPQIKVLVDQYTARWPAERRQALERALQPQKGEK